MVASFTEAEIREELQTLQQYCSHENKNVEMDLETSISKYLETGEKWVYWRLKGNS